MAFPDHWSTSSTELKILSHFQLTFLDFPKPAVPKRSVFSLNICRIQLFFPIARSVPWVVGLAFCGHSSNHGASCKVVVPWLRHVRLLLTPWTIARQLLCPRDSTTGTLEGVAVSSSRASSWPRGGAHVRCIEGGFFTTEPPRKLSGGYFISTGL